MHQLLVLLLSLLLTPTGGYVAFYDSPKSRHLQFRPLRVSTPSAPLSSASSASSSSLSASSSPPETVTLFSPSKINLFLRILRKRPDNYHDLASLFQAISLGDTLTISKSAEDKFSCNMPGVPVDSSNLVLRAIDLVLSRTGRVLPLSVDLYKRCPAQAGLGGGSANAATAMWGVNELLGRPASLDDLVAWSGDLGSDVTFFLSCGTAYCTGRGEVMTPLPALTGAAGEKVTIIKVGEGLSTPKVFGALDYDGLSERDPEELLEEVSLWCGWEMGKTRHPMVDIYNTSLTNEHGASRVMRKRSVMN